MVALGDWETYGEAHDVSANGNVIVGLTNTGGSGRTAAVWTPEDGLQSLLDVLLAGGATNLEGWALWEASAVSDDGKMIVGWGRNPAGQTEAWVANLAPVPIPSASWLIAPVVGLLVPWMRKRES
jgi:uncharacterized membrane protein